MPNLHPLLIHFPIALFTVSFCFDVLGVVLQKKEFNKFAWWVMLLGTLGMTLSIASGILAATDLNHQEPLREHIELHQESAFVVAVVYTSLLLWRIANRANLPERRWLFLLLSLVGLVAVWLTALYGGKLVYEFGVGVIKK